MLTIYARVGTSEEFCGNVVSRFHIGRDEYASIDLLLEDLSSCEREALAYIETGKRLEYDAFIRLDNDDCANPSNCRLMKSIPLPSVCLLGDQAAACLMRLITGEKVRAVTPIRVARNTGIFTTRF